jgi:hypothetical protein
MQWTIYLYYGKEHAKIENDMKLLQREKSINGVVYNNYHKLEQRIRSINNIITSDPPQMDWIDYTWKVF